MLPDVFTPSFLRQLEMLTLGSRRAFLGQRQGAHLSLKRGHGIEFFDYRKYELGDNPRHIDWGLYGRSEKLYVKRFREEQALSVLMLMDSSPSMGVEPESGLSKWAMARNLALSLSYVALMKQDTVYTGFTSGGAIPRFSGAQGIHRLSSFYDKVVYSQPPNMVREVMRISARIRFPGVAFFFSDLLFPFEDLQQSINILLAKNLDITVVRIRSELEQNPFRGAENVLAIDSETDERIELVIGPALLATYQERLAAHIAQCRSFLSSRGVRLIDVDCEKALPQIIVQDLAKAGVLQQ